MVQNKHVAPNNNFPGGPGFENPSGVPGNNGNFPGGPNPDGSLPGGPSPDGNNLPGGSGDDGFNTDDMKKPKLPGKDKEKDNKGMLGKLGAGAALLGIGAYVLGKGGDKKEADEDDSKVVVIAKRTGSGGRTIITEREEGNLRHVVTGIAPGTKTIRVTTERTDTGEEILAPADAPEGEECEIVEEKDAHGKIIRYIIRRHIITSTDSTTRIISERTSSGALRYVIVGGFSGNAIRVITKRKSTGELEMTPTSEETGELRRVTTETTETNTPRYVVGNIITGQTTTITRVLMGPRIISERTSTGEIRYVIVDQYNGNAIRTKFELDEKTGEYMHIPVKEPEGELRYVNEERTETGEVRKVIGNIITDKVTTTTRIVPGGVVQEGGSSSSRIRIVGETEGDETRYYQVTEGPDGQEVRTLVERTEDDGFRIPGGPMIIPAGAAAALIANQMTTTTRTTGNAAMTPAEQAANKTQITLQLKIMRYERADASAAVPSAPVGTVVFNKFKIIAPGEVDIDDTAHSHAEETKAPNARRTVKWMKIEAHWKREAGMLQHLKSDRYIAELFPLYSLPAFADYRYVSIMGSFSRTLDSYMKTERLTSIQIRQLTASLSDALRWCHDKHVVHLNIRPASFYLDGVLGQDATDSNGQLVWKLWNFGHARFVGEAVDTSVTTVTYAAPEILNGRKKNDTNVLAAVSMDRWSLGLILYELHAHKAYFSSGAFAEFQLTQDEGANFEPALETVKEQDASQAIRGLLEVDPEKRYTHENLRDVYFGKI
ncbi:hypothetical protein BGX34_001684 [Mortierella sp. NVP85]|nr:hypothetical protein BGX34_001684 [Mortierella sp. NVP85]